MIVFTSRERQHSVSGDIQAQMPLLSRSVSVTCVNWMPEFLSVLQESLEWALPDFSLLPFELHLSRPHQAAPDPPRILILL